MEKARVRGPILHYSIPVSIALIRFFIGAILTQLWMRPPGGLRAAAMVRTGIATGLE
jgi:hypothetical protein